MSEPKDERNASRPAPTGAAESRRDFLLAASAVAGAGVGAMVLLPAAALVADPVRRGAGSTAGTLLPAGKRAQFGPVPTKVELFDERVDAWNRFPRAKIGSVWVVAQDVALVALSSVCPHLGCSIDYDAAAGCFACPCHKSFFSATGEVIEGPSLRAMDRLEVQEDGGLVQIRWQRFKHAVAEKEPIG